MTVLDFQAPGARLDAFEAEYRARRAARARATVLCAAVFAALVLLSAIVGEFDAARLVAGLPKALNYVVGTVPTLRAGQLGEDLSSWYWGLDLWLTLLAETLLMAFVGTAFGAGAALALCFAASRNLMRHGLVYFAARRVLEIARTVPELVYALIFVYAFGLGPLAGVMAIAVHTAGSLGKLFSEVNENVDLRPVEGLRAAGAGWVMAMRLAVLPQVLPNFASYGLLRLEINVRGAAVLGLVGAGGIGEELYLAVRQFEYPDISAILLLLVVTVSLIDIACEAIRHRLIGGRRTEERLP